MRETVGSAWRFGRGILCVVVVVALVRVAVLSAADPAAGQTPTDEPTGAATSAESVAAVPQMSILRSVVELDPLWAGKPIQPEWVIRNTGNAPLSIHLKAG